MKLSHFAATLLLDCPKDVTLSGVSIDSRSVKPGDLFVAIPGERFDGHQFVNAAVEKGAVAVMVQQPMPHLSVPQLIVPDTQQALGLIAKAHRQQHLCPAIALTGSNGKTTVKEMIAAILPPFSHASHGNFNNHLGAPLSVLQLEPQHRYAVFELGASHIGDIAYTVAIAQPQVALINNIAPAHIEGFGSIDGVAKAKGEIYQGLEKEGIAIINADDAYAHFWDQSLTNKRVYRFSRLQSADFAISHLQWRENGCATFTLHTPGGDAHIELNVPGEHNVSNALAAAACTYALGIGLDQIATGLNTFKGVAGRLTFLNGKNQAVIIDDTYNANLRSVLTALDVLAKRPGRRVMILGDMGELGVWSEEHHREVGLVARQHGIETFYSCGRLSKVASDAFGSGAQHYPTQDALLTMLIPQLDATTTVLVKGSRASAMEKIVERLVDETTNKVF